MMKGKEVNRFLPWFPLKSIEEIKNFFDERYAVKYAEPQAFAHAICLKEDDFPIGYVNVDMAYVRNYGIKGLFLKQRRLLLNK